jgi:hypothetical protein
MIKRVCTSEIDEIQQSMFAIEMQLRLGCGTPQTAGLPICKTDAQTLESARLLSLRVRQVQTACSMSESQLNAVLTDWVKTSSECTSSGCDLIIWNMQVGGLGSDLARASRGHTCSYTQSALAEAMDNQARRASVDKFRRCVQNTVAALDDHTSPADVVANAVFSTCRPQLVSTLKQSAIFAETVLPNISAEVLRQRRASSHPTKKRLIKQQQA